MMKTFFAFTAFFLASVAHADLQVRWHELFGDSPRGIMVDADPTTAAKATAHPDLLKDRDVIFIKGFMPQMVHDYLGALARESVTQLGASEAAIISPKAAHPMTYNSELIYKYLVRRYAKTQKSQVIVGHSKGAGELLLALMFHPDLIKNKIVDKVVLIQAVIGGSPLALQARQVCEQNHGFCYPIYEMYQLGFFSMEPDQIGHLFDNLLRGREQEFKDLLDGHVFYVRSTQNPKDFSLRIKLAHKIIGDYPGMYDGMVPVENQYRSEFGCDLAIIENVGHLDLVAGKILKKRKLKVESFTQALFEELYSPNPVCH